MEFPTLIHVEYGQFWGWPTCCAFIVTRALAAQMNRSGIFFYNEPPETIGGKWRERIVPACGIGLIGKHPP